MSFLLVAIGAAVGAPCRFLVDRLMQAFVVGNHPRRIAIGTLTVNVVGSAILGAVLAHTGDEVALLLGTGWCGAFTTFSTFTAQTDESIREGWPFVAAANVLLSVILCFSVFWLTWSVLG